MVLKLAAIVVYLSLNFLFSQVKTDTCDTYIHSQYGKGQCMDQSQCPNSLFVSGLCESHASNIECCFPRSGTANEEFRAVWIATVENIDWPSSNIASPGEQQTELIHILHTVQLLNMNAIVFQ
ncbi:unnamed protein product, partial [Rotaria magnacalcarata]